MHKKIDGKRKKAVACSIFYVRCQQTFAVLFAIDATIKLTDEERGWTESGVRVVCMALSTWSLLYFVQLLPSIGFFVVAIQQMMRQMLNFGSSIPSSSSPRSTPSSSRSTRPDVTVAALSSLTCRKAFTRHSLEIEERRERRERREREREIERERERESECVSRSTLKHYEKK